MLRKRLFAFWAMVWMTGAWGGLWAPVAAEGVDPPLAQSDSEVRVQDADAEAAAEARQALADGRYIDAAKLLEPLVAPRHHTLSIRPSWHRDLGLAYAGLGLHRAAQGQYRLARAAAGADDARFADDVSARLAASIAASQDYAAIPDTAAAGGALFVSLAITRRGDVIRFEAGFAADARGGASGGYSQGEFEIDCARLERRTLVERRYGADGSLERTLGEGEWAGPPNALSRNLYKLLCGTAPRPPAHFDMKALAAEYGAQRDGSGP